MDHGVSESAAVQRSAGPHYGPGSHHRDRDRIVSLPQVDGEEEEKVVEVCWAAALKMSQAKRCEFLRHEQIYQSDVVIQNRDGAASVFAPIPSDRKSTRLNSSHLVI